MEKIERRVNPRNIFKNIISLIFIMDFFSPKEETFYSRLNFQKIYPIKDSEAEVARPTAKAIDPHGECRDRAS